MHVIGTRVRQCQIGPVHSVTFLCGTHLLAVSAWNPEVAHAHVLQPGHGLAGVGIEEPEAQWRRGVDMQAPVLKQVFDGERRCGVINQGIGPCLR